MKKIIALLISLLLIMGTVFVFPASATENDEVDTNIYVSEDGNYKYTYYYEYGADKDGNTISYLCGVNIIEYVGEEPLKGRYVLPLKIDGYRVRSIGEEAFANSDITKLIIRNQLIVVGKKAFYNCTKLKSVFILQNARIYDKAFGYYYDKKADKEKKVKGFAFRVKDEFLDLERSFDFVLKNYVLTNNFKIVYYLESAKLVTPRDYFLAPGFEYHIKVDGKTVKGWRSTNKSVVSVSDKGNVKILDGGVASIRVELSDGSVFIRRMRVDNNFNIEATGAPYYNYKNKPNKVVKVKKGKTAKLKLYGKVHSIKNVYTNTKIAGFVETNDDYSLKIKGYQKGTTTVKVKINGVISVRIKVKVV